MAFPEGFLGLQTPKSFSQRTPLKVTRAPTLSLTSMAGLLLSHPSGSVSHSSERQLSGGASPFCAGSSPLTGAEWGSAAPRPGGCN